jgi:hypothetical protein
VAQIQPLAAGVAAGDDHDLDRGDVGVVAADGDPGLFQGGGQVAGGDFVNRCRGRYGLAS